MKLAIDASRANNEERTGVENYAFHVIQELKKILPEHVEVILYSREQLKGGLSDLPKNWTSKVLHWPPKRLWTQVRLSFEMLHTKPDVLFIPAHVFPLIHPQKTIMTVHDVAAARYPHTYNWFERWYSTWSAKYAVSKLWRVITPSEFTKQELVTLYNADPKKIFVTPLGFDINYKIPISDTSKQKILTKFGITKPYIVFLGRLEEKKNTHRLVEAFTLIKQKHDIQLVLGGKPGFGYEKTLQNIVKSPYREDIIQTGWLSREDAQHILSGARALTTPSLYEGFGLTVLEGFACRVPVVAAKGGSLEEVGGTAALYVDAENTEEIAQTIIHVLDDDTLRHELINKGTERLTAFDWKTTAEKTFEILFS